MRQFIIGAGTLLQLLWVSYTVGQTSFRLPPTVIQQPAESVIFRSGDNITLPCRADGTPNITYSWKKNGVDLTRDLPNMRSGADGSVIIYPATSIDEGYYQCFAKNQFGTAESIISHIQSAYLDTSGSPAVFDRTVREGEPFRIQAMTRKSFPKPAYGWEIARDSVDKSPSSLTLSNRVQIADNGDLYFAFAKSDDDLGGGIYKCTTYNPHLDVKAGGSYTKVIVTKVDGDPARFSPLLGFSSDPKIVGFAGNSVILRCFFYGNPEPTVTWKFPPGSNLRNERYKLDKYDTELIIHNITGSDAGDYECTASNSEGRNSSTIQLSIETKPSFRTKRNRPHNVNATVGESVTFTCSADAIPEAKEVVWRRNGELIDVENAPKRNVFSPDKKSLTIVNICLRCKDRVTDISVIQCNASNERGYSVASGILNVFNKTSVEVKGDSVVAVDTKVSREVDLECLVEYDSRNPVKWTWYKWETYGKLEKLDSNHSSLLIDGGKLKLRLDSNESSLAESWSEHLTSYTCVADAGVSRSNKTIELQLLIPATPAPAAVPPFCLFFELPFEWHLEWHCYLVIAGLATAVAVVLVLLAVCVVCCLCYHCTNRDEYDVDGKERWAGTNPEKELLANGFFESYRVETISRTLKSSKASLSSAALLRIDEEAASLNDYGDDMGKFTEDGSFVGNFRSPSTGFE